jgi:hypothetical protein
VENIEANKAVVRRFIEDLLSCGDPVIVDPLLAPDFTDHNPSNPGLSGVEKHQLATGVLRFPIRQRS